MKSKFLYLLLFVLLITAGYSQSDQISIKPDNPTKSNYLQMDDFYLTHYLYIDLFLREGLFPEATPKDVSEILNAIKTYVSDKNKLTVEIKLPQKKNYIIRLVTFKTDKGEEMLIAFTNWSAKKKKFEKSVKPKCDCYTRWYFLNGDKMTYRKDMSSETDYNELNASDLANAYLFDELAENDSDVESTIESALAESDMTVEDRIWTNLILLKYYIFKNQSDNVKAQTEYVAELFKKHEENTDLRGMEAAFEATKFQIELMK